MRTLLKQKQMLKKTWRLTFFLAALLSFTLGGSQINASPFQAAQTNANFNKEGVLIEISEPIHQVFFSLNPVIGDFVQAQEGGNEGGSGSDGPEITSDVDFLGMDYSTAITILSVLLVLLVLTVIILTQVSGQISKLGQEESESGVKRFLKGFVNVTRPVWEFVIYRLNPTIGVLTVIGLVVVILMFGFYNRAQDLGTQIGYAPDQPVNFSHKLHAGEYNIDCQYCHTGVRKSKSANIPSTNICMNCHNAVKEGPKYGSKEIEKVVESYENNDPIEWVRIHNLPDHVYFNHSQHVNVGNLECQECHGDVENMEVVHQHAKLEMGWCINCHRNEEVDTDNGYYKETYDFVDSHSSYTVADMGGTECQKCHY